MLREEVNLRRTRVRVGEDKREAKLTADSGF